MPTMITDPSLEAAIQAQRRQTGADRYDEVWEGIYMMAPMPNTEHQQMVGRCVAILEEIVGWAGLGIVVPGVNISDREADWQQDYRVPDVAVALVEGAVRDLDSHWCGGPDLVIEVVSPGDQTRAKLPFYARIGVREVVVIDRDPWAVELHHHTPSGLVLSGRSTVADGLVLSSGVLPLTLRLIPGPKRPVLEIAHEPSRRNWHI